MLRRTFKNPRGQEHDISLQITSLADILIIVLVFLLNTFSTGIRGVANLSVPDTIKLPEVFQSGSSDRGISIEISATSVTMEKQKTISLTNYRFDGSDLKNDLPNSSSSAILSEAFAKQKPKYDANTPIWIIADKKAPYATIQTVLASAAANGFTNVKLAVVANK